MKHKRERKTRRIHLAVTPSFGKALDGYCLKRDVTMVSVIVAAVKALMEKPEVTLNVKI